MAFVVGEVSAPVSADSSKFNQAMDEVKKAGEKTANAVSDSFTKLSKKMEAIGKNLTKYVTLPIIGVGTAAFKMSKDFETELSKVVGLVGVASDQVDAWGKDILKMAPEIGKAPQEMADALFFITSAGIRGAEAMDVLEMSAKASAAGLGETKIVADLVTSAMNAYGAENLSAAQATDILVAAVREGKAEAPELAASMGAVLPIASEMGVSFDQVAGAVAAMTRTGTDAATANTQLRQIMLSLLKPAKQAEDALKMMGTSSAELRKQIREEGLLSVLMNLKDLTNQYGEEVMAQVFPNIRALSGVLDLMGSNMEANIAIMDSLTNATGLLEDAYAAAAETADMKWQRALSQVKASTISLGESLQGSLIPIIEDVTRAIKWVTDWFTSLDESQQQVILRTAAIVAAIGPALIIGSKVITLIKGIGAALAWLSANPMSMVAFGIGLLISAGISLWKNWDEIKHKAELLWDNLRIGFAKMVNKIIGQINIFLEALNRIPFISVKLIKELDTTRRVFEQTQEGMFDYSRSMDYVRGSTDEAQFAVEDFTMAQEDMAGTTSVLTSALLEEEEALKKVKKAAEEVKESTPTPDDLRWQANLRAVELQLEAGGPIVGGSKELMEALRGTVEDYSSAVADISRTKGVDLGVARSMLDADLLSKYQAKELIPHFAEGGVVYHPTLAMVGEKEPEAILPMSRLGHLNQPIHITENIYIYGNPNRADITQGLDSGNNKLIRKLKLVSPGVRI